MSQYKYYFKKPKTSIAKDIILGLALTGAVVLSGMLSPTAVASSLLRVLYNAKKYQKKNSYDVFARLKKEGYIEIQEYNHQSYISLTEEGRKKAGRFQINSLEIKKPKKWDQKWRIVIFDIGHLKRMRREAFRGKLKEIGFFMVQKSVWAHPYPCEDEIKLLRDFFKLSSKELKLITADAIWDDKILKDYFRLS